MKQAALPLCGLQITAGNLPRIESEPPRRQVVLDAPRSGLSVSQQVFAVASGREEKPARRKRRRAKRKNGRGLGEEISVT